MPCDYSNYPRNWKAIREEILNRAGNMCECAGECGVAHIPQPVLFFYSRLSGVVNWSRCYEYHKARPRSFKGLRVILTIAHLNHNTKDSRRKNLKAMCQACHLRYDAQMKAEKRKKVA